MKPMPPARETEVASGAVGMFSMGALARGRGLFGRSRGGFCRWVVWGLLVTFLTLVDGGGKY